MRSYQSLLDNNTNAIKTQTSLNQVLKDSETEMETTMKPNTISIPTFV